MNTATAAATSLVERASFTIPGRVSGKGRARAGIINGRINMRTPDATRAAETRVRDAWAAAGCPWLGTAALSVRLVLWEQRPAAHWTIRDTLSALGRRTPRPARKPDLDNIAKLVLDSLNGCLYRDDAQVCDLSVSRFWLEDPALPEYADVTAEWAVT